MNDEVLELTKKFISVPGYAELPEKEANMARVLYEILASYELEPRLVDIGDGRYNVLCTLDSGRQGPVLTLCTHLDTVPPYEMEGAFEPCICGNRLYGRGAVDVRDILASMAVTMKRLKEALPSLRGKVRFLAVADEESGSLGMRYEVLHGEKSDLVIVGEPTELNVGVAHKGVCWLQAEFFGKSAHGSVPDKGHSAILDAVLAINGIYEKIVPSFAEKRNALLGLPTVNVGVFQGGTRTTIVPDYARINIDRRLVPGESSQTALKELDDLLAVCTRESPQMRFRTDVILGGMSAPYPPLDSSDRKQIVDLITSSVRKTAGQDKMTIPLSFWTDAALPAYFCGTPAVVIGPGNIAQAHANDEFVELDQLSLSAEVYYNLVLSVCGTDAPVWW